MLAPQRLVTRNSSPLKLISAALALTISLLLMMPVTIYADGATQNATPEITRTDVERRLNMAKRLLDKNEYQQAIRNLNMTVERYRYNADAWNLLGYAHRQAGDIDAANEAYTHALSINRYHLGALEYQGQLFILMGRIDDAKINLRLMDEQCPVGCKEQRDLEAAIAEAG